MNSQKNPKTDIRIEGWTNKSIQTDRKQIKTETGRLSRTAQVSMMK